MKSFFSNNQGFTIIETLIAVAILMMAIAGPLTIAQKGLTSALYAHDQVTASYLADAMEYLKNVRDSNLINRPNNWLDKLSGCSQTNPCSVNTLTGNPNATSQSAAGIALCTGDCRLYIWSNYGYSPSSSGAVASKFTRKFYIQPINNTIDEVKIVILVEWKAKGSGITNVVTYESHIFNIIK